ncbi:MAG: DUF2961 domain-containing protein [Acidobacteriota bacterium]|nr:DUF2961 domain-containing protein [Acidobacteriota bacterium]
MSREGAGVQANKQVYFDKWWGEGEVKLYLDGDHAWPTLVGTGSEDYVGTGWGEEHYSNLFQGVLLADSKNMRYAFYRFHIPDPIYFQTDVRVTIQQIGFTLDSNTADPLYNTGTPVYAAGQGLVERTKGSVGLFERQDDWSACAYFYLSAPVDDLPLLESAPSRMKGLGWTGPYFGAR